MRYLFFLWLLVSVAVAQQMTMPDEFTAEQKKLFLKIAESVSAPCCRNGIPVAYHESGMAVYVQNLIRDAIKSGKTESQIMAQLEELRMGERQEPLIFTVPDNNSLGWLFWSLPWLIVVMGVLLVLYFLRRPRTARKDKPTNEALIEKYRDYIVAQVKALDS